MITLTDLPQPSVPEPLTPEHIRRAFQEQWGAGARGMSPPGAELFPHFARCYAHLAHLARRALTAIALRGGLASRLSSTKPGFLTAAAMRLGFLVVGGCVALSVNPSSQRKVVECSRRPKSGHQQSRIWLGLIGAAFCDV